MRTLGVSGLGLVALILLAGVVSADAVEFWFSAGPAFRAGMDAEVTGSSYVQQMATGTYGPVRVPKSVGREDQPDDRRYDDGYVKPQRSGDEYEPYYGVAGIYNGIPVREAGLTMDWDYNDPVQFDAAAGTVTFGKRGTPGVREIRSGSVSASDGMEMGGVEFKAGLVLPRMGKIKLGIAGGVEGVWGAGGSMSASTYEEAVQRIDVRDVYRVTPTRLREESPVDPGPDDPGDGDGDGGTVRPPPPGKPGAGLAIPVLPSERRTSTRDLGMNQNQIDFDVDTDVVEFWAGPRIGFDLTDYLGFYLTPKVSVTYVDVSVKRTETFTARDAQGESSTLYQWKDKESKDQWSWGAGLTAGLNLMMDDKFFAGVWGGYEWIDRDVDVQVGPNVTTVGAGGYTFGFVLGRTFGVAGQE